MAVIMMVPRSTSNNSPPKHNICYVGCFELTRVVVGSLSPFRAFGASLSPADLGTRLVTRRKKHPLWLQNGTRNDPKSLDNFVNGVPKGAPWAHLGSPRILNGPRPPKRCASGSPKGCRDPATAPKAYPKSSARRV